jgi:hypothetical protein
MLRLVGILTGSALAIAFLIMTLGMPRFSPPDAPAEAAAAAPVAEAETTSRPIEPEPVTREPFPSPPVEEVVEAPLSDAETRELIDEMFAPLSQPVTEEYSVPDTPDAEENWYAFWSPFRSEIAANGFVSRLQETTGIDYRVVKVKTGVYEVAFAYVDDADIRDKLVRISDATGLDMTGS